MILLPRRDFLKTTGLLTGGLLLGTQVGEAFAAPAANGKLRIGVIGCGDRGTGLLKILQELPDKYEVTALCDELPFRLRDAQKIGSASKAKTYADYHALLDSRNVDAVIISVPLNMHFAVAKAALLAGKQVYLEKTMTHNIEQATELVTIAQQRPNQILQVGHQYRYSPLYYRVKEMIDKGYLGKVTQIDCRWDRNGSWRRPVPEPSLERKINWRMYREYSGGLAAELLSHQIDFIHWAFNTYPDEIFGTGGIDYYKDGRETYDNVQVMMRYAREGMVGNFGATCGNARDGYLFKLKGTKGTISLLIDQGIYYPEKETLKQYGTVDGVTGATKITWDKNGGIPITTEPLKDGSWYALNEFYKAVQEKKMPDSNVFTGARVACAVYMANQAIYNHTIEKWRPEFNFS
ncbi:Gfo/Idh/MocA family protein [Hymenobacter volaticus]|uniref:Gfo/Idh/MocA family oxidoreductase n=1 Tax=Hymenobacter volaticus TaxID=2932254 RepID=A0ABY4G9P4_9BACT|nr:Gfo/Idh/MocA family oxidoreductase [Hymenobacter volaticus]UOQ67577.1 Gfo/Idh/MocA family oxidoreductase [Hymenobacter volaticus]